MNNSLAKLSATFFYLGYFPFAAGSIASAIGGLMAITLAGNMFLYFVVFAVVTAVGFGASGWLEKVLGEKDPSCIVIDEVSGALIAFFLLPARWPVLITAFFVFRAFDMFKIYPADVLEEKTGGVGVMMDDIVAGVYTNLIMQCAVRLAGIAS